MSVQIHKRTGKIVELASEETVTLHETPEGSRRACITCGRRYGKPSRCILHKKMPLHFPKKYYCDAWDHWLSFDHLLHLKREDKHGGR